MRQRTLRPLFPVIAAATVVFLASCSSPANPPGSTPAADGECISSGSVSDSIHVEGGFGSAPTVTFPTPLVDPPTQRTVVIQGEGPEVQPGQTVNVNFAMYNGTTGEPLEDSFKEGGKPQPVVLSQSDLLPGLYKALACLKVGTRAVTVISPKDAGDQGPAAPGSQPDAPLVAVMDIVSVVPDRATGTDQPVEAGLPTVTLSADGQPSVTVPSTPPPSELKIAVLKKGDGPTVQDGNSVTVQYQGTIWASNKVFDQSWGKGPTSFSTKNVVPGFAQGLIGQTVGSQVMIIIPPALGYGDKGQASAGISGTDTLVFVVDILAIS